MNDRLMRFVLELRQAGVTDARVLVAIERTPRALFAAEHLTDMALEDSPLPLPHKQIMTRPSLVGRMMMALAPRGSDSVLEIGAGSGYQAAALAAMAAKVVTLERWRDLVGEARAGFARVGLSNAFAHCADGAEGWPYDAPYDRIVLNVAVPHIPQPLLDQLAPDGILLAPVGNAAGQRLMRYRNNQREDLGPVKFAPIEAGVEAVENLDETP
jgi:protein-L-isoaspartate(D-aspartate) O-methyltransferase